MRWMRSVPQRVDDQDFHAGDKIDNRIDTPNILAQRLCPEISPSIHDPRAFWRFDIDRGAQPLVARVGRPAHIAITTNHRHPLRGAGAQESNSQFRVEALQLSWQAELSTLNH